jgi:hypothetical protein
MNAGARPTARNLTGISQPFTRLIYNVSWLYQQGSLWGAVALWFELTTLTRFSKKIKIPSIRSGVHEAFALSETTVLFMFRKLAYRTVATSFWLIH